MPTEVVHGKHANFQTPPSPNSSYQVTLVGHRTNVKDLTLAGATEWAWDSDRPAKRQDELLGLRSAFLNWFLAVWKDECAGVRDVGVFQLICEVLYEAGVPKDSVEELGRSVMGMIAESRTAEGPASGGAATTAS